MRIYLSGYELDHELNLLFLGSLLVILHKAFYGVWSERGVNRRMEFLRGDLKIFY